MTALVLLIILAWAFVAVAVIVGLHKPAAVRLQENFDDEFWAIVDTYLVDIDVEVQS